jgi:hypothetical protein
MCSRSNMRKSPIICQMYLHIIWLSLGILLQSTLVWGSCRTRCGEFTQEQYMSKLVHEYVHYNVQDELSSIEKLKLYAGYSFLACAVPQGALAMFNQKKYMSCLRTARNRCESSCRRLFRPKKIKLNPNRLSPWTFGRTTFANHSSSPAESKSLIIGEKKAEWHCLCYFEKYKGQFRRSTACRQSTRACWRLYGKIEAGTKILLKNSQYMGCSIVPGEHPAKATNSPKSHWKQSKRSGSWWSPRGCFLDQNLETSKGEAIPYK